MKEENSSHEDLMEIFIGLTQVTRCCRQDVAFCEGVTFHQFMILDAVAARKELDMADLHGILAVEKSTTTRLVNPLIKKGLLRRDKAPHDFRAATLILTDEGKTIHKRVWLCLNDFFAKVTQNIPVNKRKKLLESVMIFINAIRNSSETYNCCK
jgi:DNA-binding MarR family transcriptional regulator